MKLPVTFRAFKGLPPCVNLIYMSNQSRLSFKLLVIKTARLLSFYIILGKTSPSELLFGQRSITLTQTTRGWTILFIVILLYQSYTTESWDRLVICLSSCFWFINLSFYILQRIRWDDTKIHLLLFNLLRITNLIFLHNGKLIWLLQRKSFLRHWLVV